MKKLNYKIIAGLILMTIIIGSCKKWDNPDINNNPNQPQDVKINLLLPSAEAGLAYEVGGDLSYAERLWMQQLAGGARQFEAYDNYNFNSSEDDNAWMNMYASSMNDLYIIIQKANQQNSPGYRGIGKVLMAYSLGCMTDLFGDIPYSQAFQGSTNLSPIYDKQQAIYSSINSLLISAITDFNTTPAFHVPVPGSDDLFYGGSLANWIKADYALQARYAIHLSKVQSSTAYTIALTAADSAFTSNSDDLEFHFGNNTNENAPLYQFLNQRGDCNASEYMVDTLVNAIDPRTNVYLDTTLADYYGPQGQAPGNPGSGPSVGIWFAQVGSYYGSGNSPVPFISYVECLFIKAEAEFQTGDKADAASDYNKAIKASLAKYGVSKAAWEATYASATAANITLENIITQKYIALYLQLEVYNDWRRTGFPKHIGLNIPVNNTNNNTVPRRYPYPTSEKEYNSSHCPTATLSDRVWWDQ